MNDEPDYIDFNEVLDGKDANGATAAGDPAAVG